MSPWLLAMISGKRRVITETFTSSQTWVCPLGVSNLLTLDGEGQDGTPPTTPSTTDFLINVNYSASGTGSGGSATWANFDPVLDGWVATLFASGSLSYDRSVVTAYADGTVDVTSGPQSLAGAVPGTAYKITTGAWASSGAITASGDGIVGYNYYLAAANGANTTGFGYTFSGGAPSSAAVPVQYLNVAVTSGASYALVVPTGGSIVITYYR